MKIAAKDLCKSEPVTTQILLALKSVYNGSRSDVNQPHTRNYCRICSQYISGHMCEWLNHIA